MIYYVVVFYLYNFTILHEWFHLFLWHQRLWAVNHWGCLLFMHLYDSEAARFFTSLMRGCSGRGGFLRRQVRTTFRSFHKNTSGWSSSRFLFTFRLFFSIFILFSQDSCSRRFFFIFIAALWWITSSMTLLLRKIDCQVRWVVCRKIYFRFHWNSEA